MIYRSNFVKSLKVLEYCPNRTLSHLMKLSPIRRVPEEASVEIITQGMHSKFNSDHGLGRVWDSFG